MLSVPRLMTTLILAGRMLIVNGAVLAETRVDLALVLAVDVSFSMEPDEQDLQRHGFAEAFQSPRFIGRSVRACWGASPWSTWSGPERSIRRSSCRGP
jgi:hypothetical protein